MNAKARIATAMGESLRRQGYAASGIKQIVAASGAPNGSLYHHFPGGKREIAQEALRQMGMAYGELVGGLLADGGDLPAAIDAAFHAAALDMEQTGWVNMCPVGTVAGEVASVEPEIRATAAEVFDAWVDLGVGLCVNRGYSVGDARELMLGFIAAMEGAFTVARTMQSREPLLAAGRMVARLAASLPKSEVRSG